MKTIPTLSIGIPAYNEGSNIVPLLQKILAQKESGFRLKEVFVVSDGSSDDTEAQVHSIKDKRIVFVDDGKRLGKSARLNQIFRMFTGDVLFLMDADITFTDPELFARTIRNGKLKKSGLAGVNALPLKAETFFEDVLEAGVMFTKDIATRWNNGNNYLAYKGCFLALDGTFAKKLHMPESIINNDAYLYFAAVQGGFSPAYLKMSKVYYRSPGTLADHLKQSSRFKTSEAEMRQNFTLDWEKQYSIPRSATMIAMAKSLLIRPTTFLTYLGVFAYTKLNKQTGIKSTWSIANSTKGKIAHDKR